MNEKLENSVSEINKKILKSYNFFHDEWKNTDIKYRQKILKDISKQILFNKDELSYKITEEVFKPIKESIIEVEYTYRIFKYYSEIDLSFYQPKNIVNKNFTCKLINEPLGVILGIMPWNFPISQTAKFIVPTILSGNTCLVKPSSKVKKCSIFFNNIIKNIENAEKIFDIILIRGEKLRKILNNNKISGVSVTGSTYTGSKVAEICGKNIKKTVLELGGIDPMIILEDSDINLAVDSTIKSRLRNCGQTCTASKKIIISSKIFNIYINMLIEKIKKIKIGDPFDPKTDMGPLIDEKSLHNILLKIKDAKIKGAKIILGGNKIGKGNYLEPTIICNINKKMDIYKEEIFGPLINIFIFKNINKAIQIANDNDYGLGASIFTKNINKANYIASQIRCGMVSINSRLNSHPSIPFGGTKKSGYGRQMSIEGVLEFTNKKSIILNNIIN